MVNLTLLGFSDPCLTWYLGTSYTLPELHGMSALRRLGTSPVSSELKVSNLGPPERASPLHLDPA